MVFDANGCDSTGVDVVSPSLAHGGPIKFRVPRFVHCSGHIQHEDTFIWSASRSSRNFVTVFSGAAGTKNQSESVSGLPLPSRVRLKICLGSPDEAARRLINACGSTFLGSIWGLALYTVL